MERGQSRGPFPKLVRSPGFPRVELGGKGVLVLAVLILCYGLVLLRTGWLSDDAYITFRTIDNFENGHGLTWNVSERVEVFTHPHRISGASAQAAGAGAARTPPDHCPAI